MVWPAVRWDLQIHISKSQSGCFQELFFWPDKSSCPLINCHQLAAGPNAMAQTPLCQKTSILGEFALHFFPINASVSKSLLARSAQRCKVGSYFRALLFPISSELAPSSIVPPQPQPSLAPRSWISTQVQVQAPRSWLSPLHQLQGPNFPCQCKPSVLDILPSIQWHWFISHSNNKFLPCRTIFPSSAVKM